MKHRKLLDWVDPDPEETLRSIEDLRRSLELDYICEGCAGKLTSDEYQLTRPLCTKCAKKKIN